MTAAFTPIAIPLDTLRAAIAQAVWAHAKSYEVPAITLRWGLAPGTEEEANRSKKNYVKSRIRDWDAAALLIFAQAVLKEYGDEALADLVDEITTPAEARITELTRRDVLKALNDLKEELFGDTGLFPGLQIICKARLGEEGDEDAFGFETLTGRIRRHVLRFGDWTHEDLLITCGALTCSQPRFFRLLEKLLDPVVRRGEAQRQLAARLNPLLEADGFRAVVVGEQSRHPRYAIERIRSGVAGKPKNLIFAAINAKPDLYFADAINNDIAIRNATDALMYEEFVPDAGVRWGDLAQWWQQREGIANPAEARSTLYRRLAQAVRATGSPGQFAIFDSYYREFGPVLNEALPALIPEVYLHYDPRIRKERGADPALLRQRMDFLLLLDRNVRIVLEVDGSHHYAEAQRAAPAKYAQMVSEDRRLRLTGYELYRFGAAEFYDTSHTQDGTLSVGPHSRQVVVEFFERLWRRHELTTGARIAPERPA